MNFSGRVWNLRKLKKALVKLKKKCVRLLNMATEHWMSHKSSITTASLNDIGNNFLEKTSFLKLVWLFFLNDFYEVPLLFVTVSCNEQPTSDRLT